MKTRRRGPVENSAMRDALIDATEQLIREEGYAAVSTRRIAAKAGVKGPLIHYYFNTIDDLYLAVFRRIADEGLAEFCDVFCERVILAIQFVKNEYAQSLLIITHEGIGT